eukprot:845596-Rhodomonas_salina.1
MAAAALWEVRPRCASSSAPPPPLSPSTLPPAQLRHTVGHAFPSILVFLLLLDHPIRSPHPKTLPRHARQTPTFLCTGSNPVVAHILTSR